VTLYAGLIGSTLISSRRLVPLLPALAADSLGQMVLRIEATAVCPGHQRSVLRCMRATNRSRALGARPGSPRPT